MADDPIWRVTLQPSWSLSKFITARADATVTAAVRPQPDGLGLEERVYATATVDEAHANAVWMADRPPRLPLREYVFDLGGETLAFYRELIQAAYRRVTLVQQPPDPLQPWVVVYRPVYEYAVLCCLGKLGPLGAWVGTCQFVTDPDFDTTVDPPVDPSVGTEGFLLAGTWTAVPFNV